MELNSGWPKVRAGRTVTVYILEKQRRCRLLRILISPVVADFLGSSEGLVEVDGLKCYPVLSLGVQCYAYVRTGCGV